MFGFWSVVAVLAFALAALVAYTLVIARRIGMPTTGDRIDLGDRPNSAFVVIDVQEDFTRRTGKDAFDPAYRDAAIDNINDKLTAARSEGEDVVFIKHVFRDWPAILIMKLIAGGTGTPGREGLRIDPALDAADAPVFDKSIGDAFSNDGFEKFLADRKVGHLKLAGLDACQCVQLTAKGALARGYSVEIIEPTLLTATPDKWPALKKSLGDAGVAFA